MARRRDLYPRWGTRSPQPQGARRCLQTPRQDAGALLLKETDRVIGLSRRFAECFIDRRRPELVEHMVQKLVGQRVFGIALGYEDINDHEDLRREPVMAVLATLRSFSDPSFVPDFEHDKNAKY